MFRPVWGASAGDELAILFRPDQPLDHCFVIFNFSTATEEKCGLTADSARTTGREADSGRTDRFGESGTEA